MGREHGAKVVGCESNKMFRIESMVQRLQILCRLRGFVGKEQVAKVAGL